MKLVTIYLLKNYIDPTTMYFIITVLTREWPFSLNSLDKVHFLLLNVSL